MDAWRTRHLPSGVTAGRDLFLIVLIWGAGPAPQLFISTPQHLHQSLQKRQHHQPINFSHALKIEDQHVQVRFDEIHVHTTTPLSVNEEQPPEEYWNLNRFILYSECGQSLAKSFDRRFSRPSGVCCFFLLPSLTVRNPSEIALTYHLVYCFFYIKKSLSKLIKLSKHLLTVRNSYTYGNLAISSFAHRNPTLLWKKLVFNNS